MSEPRDYAQMWLDGGEDPTFDQIDGFLYRHFNARAVYARAERGASEGLREVQRYALEWDEVYGQTNMELDPTGRWCLFDEVTRPGLFDLFADAVALAGMLNDQMKARDMLPYYTNIADMWISRLRAALTAAPASEGTCACPCDDCYNCHRTGDHE